jgi:hypothetical protein
MSIFNHFQHLKLSPSQVAALTKIEVFLNSSIQVFMLKGYAGSGKTTLIKGLIQFLEESKQSFSVMAPTGRAAKVIRDKTGHGVTIHKGIYNFNKLQSINQESEDDAEHSFHYYFPLNNIEDDGHIIIVDESSMISNVKSNHELFTFGTNVLLSDLLTFAKLKTSKNKIIFIGDPAQLPPVSDSKSSALDKNYFISELKINVVEVEMTDVMRQDENLILANALTLRSILKQEKRNELIFQYDETSFIKTDGLDFISKFVDAFPKPEIGDGVIISYSNTKCYHYNTSIREKIFPDQAEVVPGDLLLINNNNYHTYGVELYNGDIAKVIEVSNDIISLAAPVYCDEGGKKIKKTISIDFKKISIRIPNHPNDIDCYIINSLLHSFNRDLSINEMKALYINFVIRFNEKQKTRKDAGLPTYKIGSEEFKNELKVDPFFNALKVKFGYAITCHKAQGGEWDKVFIDYEGQISLKNNPLRWCYTATTRGKNVVFATNVPYFHKMAHLNFSAIGGIGSLPKDSLSLQNIPKSPFHKDDQSKCKSLKFWEIKEKLENTSYTIANVETFGNYLERYTIKITNDTSIQLQASHTGSGHFVEAFKVLNNAGEVISKELEQLFNADFQHQFFIDYQPKYDFLADLHSRIQQLCLELKITLTNVQEGHYFVNYYFKTDSFCSYIQFYYNDNQQLTTANPKSFQCDNDSKLNLLIQALLSYANS